MAKADHIIALANAALAADKPHVVSVCRQILAGEKPTSSLHRRLARLVERAPGYAAINAENLLKPEVLGFVAVTTPPLDLGAVSLPRSVEAQVERFLSEQRADTLLKQAGLSPPHRLLLSGPAGNGKTVLAGAIAQALDIPFLVVDYSKILSSYMGSTGANLAKVFRGVIDTPCVLFIDEMETLLSDRGGPGAGKTEVGEIGRVVSTLLLEVDRLPTHVILVGATNYEDHLDKSILRRFDHHWVLPGPPGDGNLRAWLERFARRYPDIPITAHWGDLFERGVKIQSFAHAEHHVLRWCRAWVMEHASDYAETDGE